VAAGALVPRCTDEDHTAHVALLQRVTPHLERALQVNRQLSGAGFRWRAAEECFNRLQVGVVLVGPNLSVQFANTEAQRLLRQEDGLSLDRDGHLVAGSPDDNVRLRQSLLALVAPPAIDRLGAGGILSVRRRSGGRPYGLLVAGLRAPAGLFEAAAATAIIFISEGSRRRQPSAERLAEAFGLTPAEGRLLQVLLRGQGLREAAACLGISANTAKTHLRALFDKLGCARQAELVRSVMSHPVWLAGGEERR
jgi:DNA-binding CsgD family transcriptional regulator